MHQHIYIINGERGEMQGTQNQRDTWVKKNSATKKKNKKQQLYKHQSKNKKDHHGPTPDELASLIPLIAHWY